MSNPFDALNISDDEQDTFVQNNKSQKTRITHKQRKQLKKQGTTSTPTPAVVNTQVPIHKAKQTGFQHKHKRQGGRPVKGIPTGHTLDRRSGTGRQDRPRKQGGGYGNVGNVKDQFKSQKYQKPTEGEVLASTEEIPVQEQVKPEQPQALTLAEYYQSKGVDINAPVARKVPTKGEINAEWLKKEKLTVVQTKEDKKKLEVVKQNLTSHNNTKVQLDLGNPELLGFGTKPAQKQREQQPQNHHDNKHHKGKKGPKVVLKEDDFPTL